MSIRTAVIVCDLKSKSRVPGYRQWPGKWPNGSSLAGKTFFISPVEDSFDADWLIYGAPGIETFSTTVPKSRRILLILEPPEYWRPPVDLLDQFGWIVSPYFIPEFGGAQIPSVTTGLFWWYGVGMEGHRPTRVNLDWEGLVAEEPTPKLPLVSTVTSAKSFLPGHRARLMFTAMLGEALGDRLHVYGHGFREVEDKRDVLVPYQYHLAIENSSHPHYWTEKLADPLLGRCKVFYYGATEVGRYFSSEAVVAIDIDRPQEAVDKILHSIQNEKVDHMEIERAREMVLRVYNFPFFIDKLIDSIEVQVNLGV